MRHKYTYYFVKSSRMGEGDYYVDRKRGTVDVYHDDKRYVYRKPDDVRDFKHWLAIVFDRGDGVLVTGRYPVYHIERR